MNIFCAVGTFFMSVSIAVSAQSQEFSVPEKPNKREISAKNAEVNDRNPAGYVKLSSTIVIPLEGGNYGVLYGVLAGKRKGDSFHYFENKDLGLFCVGTGKPTNNGGIVTNECFVHGVSTGKQSVVVPDFGKPSGKMLFNIYDNGKKIGLAAMQWGLGYPNYKKLYKFLSANGG